MIETKSIFTSIRPTCLPSLGICLMWMILSSHPIHAQSGAFQLNLLLEKGQIMDWTREYRVVIADQLPATILLGRLEGENTVVGILRTAGLGDRLVLHGIQTDDQFNLHEWIDNNIRSGELEIVRSGNSITGYWFNQDRTIRLSIRSEDNNQPFEIRQYQHDQDMFFTRYRNESEELLDESLISTETWEEISRPYQRCYDIAVNSRKIEFCRTGSLGLYLYNRIDLVRILHGLVPQIPHDEVFNSRISGWLEEWADQIFQDSITEPGDLRWSSNQAIWFIPDYITQNLVSGLLSIQFSGDKQIHSRSVIYDRQKNAFYTPDDFFRSHTSWGDNFQQTAAKVIYEAHGKTIDVFPEIMGRIKYHMTLTPGGILISSDYNPYFGRLEVQLDFEDYQNDLQRFAPFRKLLSE